MKPEICSKPKVFAPDCDEGCVVDCETFREYREQQAEKDSEQDIAINSKADTQWVTEQLNGKLDATEQAILNTLGFEKVEMSMTDNEGVTNVWEIIAKRLPDIETRTGILSVTLSPDTNDLNEYFEGILPYYIQEGDVNIIQATIPEAQAVVGEYTVTVTPTPNCYVVGYTATTDVDTSVVGELGQPLSVKLVIEETQSGRLTGSIHFVVTDDPINFSTDDVELSITVLGRLD